MSGTVIPPGALFVSFPYEGRTITLAVIEGEDVIREGDEAEIGQAVVEAVRRAA